MTSENHLWELTGLSICENQHLENWLIFYFQKFDTLVNSFLWRMFVFFFFFHARIGTRNFHKPSLLLGTGWNFLTTEIVTLVSSGWKANLVEHIQLLIWIDQSNEYPTYIRIFTLHQPKTHTFITTLWWWMFSNAHFHLMIFYFCTIKISRWKRMKTMKFTPKKKPWKNKGDGKQMKRYTKQKKPYCLVHNSHFGENPPFTLRFLRSTTLSNAWGQHIDIVRCSK